MTETAPGNIHRIAVIGAGTMGRQIAALAAAHGHPVTIFDVVPGAIDRAREQLQRELPDVLAKGMWPSSIGEITGRISPAHSLDEAVTGVDLVIEAVKEDLTVKRSVFADLSRVAPDKILATNSSSLPSARIADVVTDPSRLLNLHFFAPIWTRPMLEIMSSGRTDPAIIDTCARWGRSVGLTVAVCNGQSMGFIINRIWRAVKRESLRVVDEGHATPEDIDRLWMRFFGSDFGPFGMMDTVGLDTVADIEASYIAVSTDPEDRVSSTLRDHVQAGHLGEKSGRGFYQYPDPAYRRPDFLAPAAQNGESTAPAENVAGSPPGR